MRNFALKPPDVEKLGEQGYFIRDHFLARDTSRVVRRSVEQLVRKNTARFAGAGSARRHRRRPALCGDYITWLDRTDGGYPWDLVAERFEQLRVALNRMGYLGLRDHDVQIARYPGDGSGVDRHLDARRHGADRRITATVYLNPDWETTDGGQLRLYPPASDDPVDIAPLAGRLVAFLGDEVEHAVRPTHTPRSALSARYRGRTPQRPNL